MGLVRRKESSRVQNIYCLHIGQQRCQDMPLLGLTGAEHEAPSQSCAAHEKYFEAYDLSLGPGGDLGCNCAERGRL